MAKTGDAGRNPGKGAGSVQHSRRSSKAAHVIDAGIRFIRAGWRGRRAGPLLLLEALTVVPPRSSFDGRQATGSKMGPYRPKSVYWGPRCPGDSDCWVRFCFAWFDHGPRAAPRMGPLLLLVQKKKNLHRFSGRMTLTNQYTWLDRPPRPLSRSCPSYQFRAYEWHHRRFPALGDSEFSGDGTAASCPGVRRRGYPPKLDSCFLTRLHQG